MVALMKDKLGRKRMAKFVFRWKHISTQHMIGSVSRKTKCTKKDCIVKQEIRNKQTNITIMKN